MNKYDEPVNQWLIEHYGSFGKNLASNLASLTEEHRNFCDRYLDTGNVMEAARDAGIKEKSPQLLLHIPKISAYLNILAAKREVDLGRASTAEMLDRIRATPIVASDDQLLPPETLAEINEQLAEDGLGVSNATDDELLANAAPDGDMGIMQVPPVTMLHNTAFGPEWVLEQLVRVAERCLQIEPVYDRKGRPIGEFKFEANAALKSLELVGKTMAMFKERVELGGAGGLDSFDSTQIDERMAALIEKHPNLAKGLVLEHTTKSDRKH